MTAKNQSDLLEADRETTAGIARHLRARVDAFAEAGLEVTEGTFTRDADGVTTHLTFRPLRVPAAFERARARLQKTVDEKGYNLGDGSDRRLPTEGEGNA